MKNILVLAFVLISSTASAQLTILHQFSGGVDGAQPNAGVINYNGSLVGTTWSSPTAGTFFVLEPNGAFYSAIIPAIVSSNNPQGLTTAVDGEIYGVSTGLGGSYGMGEIYRSNGTLTPLHAFTGPDGAYPMSAMIRGPNEYLFGTTSGGGASNAGTIFRLALDGTLTTLHSFDGGLGGNAPVAMIAAADGSLVGITQRGGAFGNGVLFQLIGSQMTVLSHFPIGLGPASLMQASNSMIYITTLATTAHGGCIVRTAPSSWSIVVLRCLTRTFEGESAGTLLEVDGVLYGASQSGGLLSGGTLFKMALDEQTTAVLHSFNNDGNGWSPRSPLVQVGGDLVGATRYGGLSCIDNSGCGVVFKYHIPNEIIVVPGILVNEVGHERHRHTPRLAR